jgi:DNA modification methylase
VAQIAASIREWGWTNPVLIDEAGGIIAGHGRVMAARKLKIEDVPCIVASGWTDAQKRAYVLADNQLAANAGWDMDLLKVEIGDLKTEGFDVGLIGFDADWLNTLMADAGTDGLTDPDEVPEVSQFPVSATGDVWVLGKHRLLCGDSTVATDVDKVLMGVRPLLMVTDPPYGVEYDANWRNEADRANGKPYGARAVGKVQNDDKADWTEAWALFPGEVAYIWHAGIHAGTVATSIQTAGFELRGQIIWAKQQFAIGRGHYHWMHEPCWYAVRKGGTGHWAGDRKQTTLWQIDKPRKSETGHSTQKPVECMKRPIENNSTPGQAVYEPFSGSGTTIIAAEMTGRQCLAIELAPEYVDVAVKRWQAFTGKEATLEATGQTFAELTEARHVPA